MKISLLSIVITFLNEEENLAVLVPRLVEVVEPLVDRYEIIMINDASTDKSLEICLKLREKYGNILIINMSRTFGVQPCYLAGLENASGDAVMIIKSDLQDPPEIAAEFIRKYEEGCDVVHAVMESRSEDGTIRGLAFKLAHYLISRLSNPRLPMYATDYKLISRRVIDEILRIGEYDPFVRGLSSWVGFSQAFVPYVAVPRRYGKSKSSFFGIKPYKEFLRGITSFSNVPLYFSLIIGGTISVVSFAYLINIIIRRIFDIGEITPGWTSQMVAITFMGGTILLFIGILGIYIGKIYESTKGRPRYIISDRIKPMEDNRIIN